MRISLLAAILLIASCSSKTGNMMPVGASHAAKPANCQIEILKRAELKKPFEKIADVQVHIESTFFAKPGFNKAERELKKQACLAGADAITDVTEKQSRYIETGMYDVKAAAIRYLK